MVIDVNILTEFVDTRLGTLFGEFHGIINYCCDLVIELAKARFGRSTVVQDFAT